MEHQEKDRPHRLLSRGPHLVRTKLQGKMFLVPGFVTVVAFFCGFLGAVSAINGQFEYATKCIAFAILFDGLDGRVARRLNATSAFGREFDSLSDVVAFGVAPALLVYSWAFRSAADELGIVIVFVFAVCGAARLARFNVTTSVEPKKYFQGLPIPGAAAAVAALVYLLPAPVTSPTAVGAISVYMVLLGAFMISSLPYFSLKHVKLTQQNARLNVLILGVAVALSWYHSRIAIFVGATGYALLGPLTWIAQRSKENRRSSAPTAISA